MRTAETEPGGGESRRRREARESTTGSKGAPQGDLPSSAPTGRPQPPPRGGCELPRTHLPPRRCRAPAPRETRPQGIAAPPVGPASGPGAVGLRSCAPPPPPPARAPARDPAAAGPTQVLPAKPPARARGPEWGTGDALAPHALGPREVGAAAEVCFVCAAGAGMSGREWSPRPRPRRARAEPGRVWGLPKGAKPFLQLADVGPSRRPSPLLPFSFRTPQPRRCAHLLSATPTRRLIVARQLGGGSTRAPGSELSARRGGCWRGSRRERCPAHSEAADTAGGGKRASESHRGRGLAGRGCRARIRSACCSPRLPRLR